MSNKLKEDWDLIIKPERSFFHLNIISLFNYRDLVYMFVKRDFVVFYKQTILGPLWYIIQPLVNTIIFTIIFGKVAKIPTDGIPPFIFYLAGNVVWGYFSTCLNLTSNTFVINQALFGKVYFPRLVVPISHVLISLLQFFIQFIIFLLFLTYFYFYGAEVTPNYFIFFLPLLLLQIALLSLGCGTIISALTAKYRDLTFAMTFLVQLWMFATPIVYPLSLIPENYRFFAVLNPMTSIVEIFRGAFLGQSTISLSYILTSIALTLLLLIAGLFLFNRVEKNFMDTV